MGSQNCEIFDKMLNLPDAYLTFHTVPIFQFRASDVIELQSFKPASVNDIASVHAKAYVSGLEKVAIHVAFNLIF